jgi:hypothetical protein
MIKISSIPNDQKEFLIQLQYLQHQINNCVSVLIPPSEIRGESLSVLFVNAASMTSTAAQWQDGQAAACWDWEPSACATRVQCGIRYLAHRSTSVFRCIGPIGKAKAVLTGVPICWAMTNQTFFWYLLSFFGIFSVDKDGNENGWHPVLYFKSFPSFSDLDISHLCAPILIWLPHLAHGD